MWFHFTDEKLRPTGKWLKALQGTEQYRVDLCPLSGQIRTQLRQWGDGSLPGEAEVLLHKQQEGLAPLRAQGTDICVA